MLWFSRLCSCWKSVTEICFLEWTKSQSILKVNCYTNRELYREGRWRKTGISLFPSGNKTPCDHQKYLKNPMGQKIYQIIRGPMFSKCGQFLPFQCSEITGFQQVYQTLTVFEQHFSVESYLLVSLQILLGKWTMLILFSAKYRLRKLSSIFCIEVSSRHILLRSHLHNRGHHHRNRDYHCRTLGGVLLIPGDVFWDWRLSQLELKVTNFSEFMKFFFPTFCFFFKLV